MSFAFTTQPAGQQQESVARYLTMPGRVVDLGTAATQRFSSFEISGLVADAIGPDDDEATTVAIEAGTPRALSAARVHVDVETEGTSSLAVSAEAPPAPAEVAAGEPDLKPGDRVTATVSFYYCELGDEGLHPGDGGNFCGVMRDGTVVYPGAAACAYTYLGQQFRIVGDPTGRVYRCADTGSAVHGLHRDIWFMSSDEGWAWQLEVGQVATIEILP